MAFLATEIMPKEIFTSENCIYWIKKPEFKNWKMAIYSKENDEFRLVDNRNPPKETSKFNRKDCGYMVAMEVKTELS